MACDTLIFMSSERLKYDHKAIEKKWQDEWTKSRIYNTHEDPTRPKSYVLDMFPYPSGEGLHVGHPKGYIASDIYARHKRMMGHSVLHPMGWDAFGLPAENYALQNKVHPRLAVEKNIARYKEQLSMIGFDYDWSREINTTDPAYYKWTQWIFLKLFEKGLAYESYEPINWCPSCKTGLANEDLEDGRCERCGSIVEKRPMRQWVLRITDYADRLLHDLEELSGWPEHIKISQRHWIGRSEGAEIDFQITNSKKKIKVFTTRPDTLFGATYMVLAPEHPLVKELEGMITNADEMRTYMQEAAARTEIERTAEGKEKTGVELKGVKAINPANQEDIPVFIADYVLAHYGTGAIMAVPAHDERDLAFAQKYGIQIRQVVAPYTVVVGKDAPKSDKDIVKFDAATAVIKHWEKDLYCTVAFSDDWHGLVGGHVESGEKAEEAVVREVTEESGYADIKNVRLLFEYAFSRGYKTRKSREEECRDSAYIVELASGARVDITDHETKKGSWMTAEEILKLPTFSNHHKLFFEHYIRNRAYTDAGVLVNSGSFNGLPSEEAKKKITEAVGGKCTASYKLRDWVFSRQLYWGEPIPLILCEKCGVVPIPEKDLPVLLPEVRSYEPTGTGESPLAAIAEWATTTCPKCGGRGMRETNTMPQWAGSSWYYLRYMDPHNDRALVASAKEKYWAPVDMYVGGAEHATRHLIYARFWHKFLFDIGVVHTKEPFMRLHSVGLILAENGRKMSKRYGNVINPDDIVQTYGADTLRVYEMFMGPFEGAIAWNTDSMIGSRRFIERVWRQAEDIQADDVASLDSVVHRTIQKVSDDIEIFKFNTAISQLMILLNEIDKVGIGKKQWETYLKLLAPFAPHIAEELWHGAGQTSSVHRAEWPRADKTKAVAEDVTIAVQVNGKVRATLTFSAGTSEEDILQAALIDARVIKWVPQGAPLRRVYVPGRILSLTMDKS